MTPGVFVEVAVGQPIEVPSRVGGVPPRLVEKAFVVKKDQSLTAQELIVYATERLTRYKVPKHIEFRTELPKTNVGKILRRALRDEKPPAVASCARAERRRRWSSRSRPSINCASHC